MAYFLKKTTLKGRTYLSIVESFYSPDKRGAAHRTYKSLASVETWIKKGIDDPIAYFQKEVDALNKERQNNTSPKISEISPELYLGYFPIAALMKKINIKKDLDLFTQYNHLDYDLNELISSLIYANLVNNHKTFHEILPQLKENISYSYDQLLNGLDFMGNDYHKFIELFNEQIKTIYTIDTSKTYFYLETFKNDDDIGLGLILDANQIPIEMKLFSKNENEKLSDVINNLKIQNITAKKNTEASLFTKADIQKTWLVLENDTWVEVKDTNDLKQIEESFNIMKSDLKEENTIKGHFLICYLAILLERILQFKILNNQYSTSQIRQFIKSFKIIKGESKYINITTSSDFINDLVKLTNLPLTDLYLTERQIKQILNLKL